MISIKNIAYRTGKNAFSKPHAEFISSEECNKLINLKYFQSENLINDGKGLIILGNLEDSSKANRDYDFVPVNIIRPNNDMDQAILQTKLDDGTDDMLIVFWNPDDSIDASAGKDHTTPNKIRGGYRIHGQLKEQFIDGSRSSLSYIYKTRRIHRIGNEHNIRFFAFERKKVTEEKIA